MKYLREVCKECGFTLGSHFSGTKPWPNNTCPATEDGVDFDLGPGTQFKPSGIFKEKNNDRQI